MVLAISSPTLYVSEQHFKVHVELNFAVTLIPATMLWKIRVSWRRKLIVAGVLSLTVVTISLACLRLYLLISPSWVFENGNLDMNWLNLEVYVGEWIVHTQSIPKRHLAKLL